MTDYQGFKYGNVQFPLPAIGAGLGGAGASLLQDVDPPLYFLLEFYKSILETHLGARMLEEVAVAGANQITAVVGESIPIDPAPYLIEEHIRFPLLAAYRKSTKPAWIGRSKLAVDEVEVVFALPPLQAGEAERLMPLLKAVYSVLDNRTEQGFDPAYTPSGGVLGGSFWKAAGLVSAGVMGASYGAYAGADRLYFPTITLSVELREKSDFALEEFEKLDRNDINIDLAHPPDVTVSDFVQLEVYPDALLTQGGEAILIEGDEALADDE